jgi:hypothetical protein
MQIKENWKKWLVNPITVFVMLVGSAAVHSSFCEDGKYEVLGCAITVNDTIVKIGNTCPEGDNRLCSENPCVE